MNLYDLLPKFIKKILTLRDYRMTKAELSLLKNKWIPNYRIHVEEYGKHFETRPKYFYEAQLEEAEKLEQFLTEYMIELTDKMNSLGLRLE